MQQSHRRHTNECVQEQVQAALDELVASGAEQGLQVAVYRHGRQIVDAVAGVADPTTGRVVTVDTPFFSYSIGKGVAATVLHVLAERTGLDYDTPIAELWPEFSTHGKHTATVRHALSQSAGVPGLPQSVTVGTYATGTRCVRSSPARRPGGSPARRSATTR